MQCYIVMCIRSYLFWTGAEIWGLQASPHNCSASTPGGAIPCTSLGHSGSRYWITYKPDHNMTFSFRWSPFVHTSQWPTDFFYPRNLTRSLPGRHHSSAGYHCDFSSLISYSYSTAAQVIIDFLSLLFSYSYPIRSEMVGKMVNGTGLSDDRRVSEQVKPNM